MYTNSHKTWIPWLMEHPRIERKGPNSDKLLLIEQFYVCSHWFSFLGTASTLGSSLGLHKTPQSSCKLSRVIFRLSLASQYSLPLVWADTWLQCEPPMFSCSAGGSIPTPWLLRPADTMSAISTLCCVFCVNLVVMASSLGTELTSACRNCLGES